MGFGALVGRRPVASGAGRRPNLSMRPTATRRLTGGGRNRSTSFGVRREPSGTAQRRHRPDYWLLLLGIILMVVGLIVIFSISPGLAAQRGVGENYYVTKQMVAIGMGVAAFVVMANVPLAAWERLQKPLIAAAAAAAVAVRLFGEEVLGAYRWIQVGGLSFQAVELIKFALLIWLAKYLSDKLTTGGLDASWPVVKPIAIALAAIGLVVAGVQSDLGSTGVMVAMVVVMVFVAGMPVRKLAAIVGCILIATILLISTSGYRRDRVATFLNPTADCQNEGYQACQALIAIGSGGMFGLGLSQGVQAYGYLPEAANDSIFAILAEKFGFVGVTVLLGLFVALFARMKRISERAPDAFSQLVVVGVLAWLASQAFINIGAMIGLLPLKGITLPFISYGGTSLMFVMGAVGLVFQISRYTSYSIATSTERIAGNDDHSYRRRVRGAYHPSAGSRT